MLFEAHTPMSFDLMREIARPQEETAIVWRMPESMAAEIFAFRVDGFPIWKSPTADMHLDWGLGIPDIGFGEEQGSVPKSSARGVSEKSKVVWNIANGTSSPPQPAPLCDCNGDSSYYGRLSDCYGEKYPKILVGWSDAGDGGWRSELDFLISPMVLDGSELNPKPAEWLTVHTDVDFFGNSVNREAEWSGWFCSAGDTDEAPDDGDWVWAPLLDPTVASPEGTYADATALLTRSEDGSFQVIPNDEAGTHVSKPMDDDISGGQAIPSSEPETASVSEGGSLTGTAQDLPGQESAGLQESVDLLSTSDAYSNTGSGQSLADRGVSKKLLLVCGSLLTMTASAAFTVFTWANRHEISGAFEQISRDRKRKATLKKLDRVSRDVRRE